MAFDFEIEFVDGPLAGEKSKASDSCVTLNVPEIKKLSSHVTGPKPWLQVRLVTYQRIGASNRFEVSHYGPWEDSSGFVVVGLKRIR